MNLPNDFSFRALPRSTELIKWLLVIILGTLVGYFSPRAVLVLTVWLFHEGGHAFGSWLVGRFAIPTPIFTSIMPIPGFRYALLLATGVLTYLSFQKKYLALGFFFAYFTAISALLAIFMSSRRQEELIIIFGLLGESWLAALALGFFFARVPPFFRWELYRWIVAFLAAISLGNITRVFCHAAKDLSKLPMGGFMDFLSVDTGKSGGDLNRLINEFGWTPASLSSFYLAATLLAWGALVCFVCVMIRLGGRRMISD